MNVKFRTLVRIIVKMFRYKQQHKSISFETIQLPAARLPFTSVTVS